MTSVRTSAAALLVGVRSQLHPTDDHHRVTTLELLFDLVFVYCITNTTALMEHSVGGRTIMEGLVALALVWFGWCAYTWLGNQAKADEGLLRLAMIVAMGGMFFVAISIPHAFDEHGNAALILAVAYLIVRFVHVGVYLIAAGDDAQLRSVVLGMLGVTSAAGVPLLIGALTRGHALLYWWLAAVLIDQAGVYFVRSSRWVLHSASHCAERFGQVILIAIGESIVDIGAVSTRPTLDLHLGVALVCGITVAVCLWWLYFDVVALVGERTLTAANGIARARLARDSYTFIHLPMVAGIVFTAMGLSLLISRDHGVGAQVGGEHVDAGRYALYGGIALYLAAHLLFRWRNIGSLNVQRAVVLLTLLVAIPLTGALPALAQLAFAAAVLAALVGYEVTGQKQWRGQVRSAEPA